MLPVILKAATDEAYNNLVNEYVETYNEKPSINQENAWKKLLDLLQELNVPHPIILEYPIFTERADIIFVDKDKAVVVEAKGWRSVKKLGDNVVEADDSILHILLYSFHFYLNAMCRLVRAFRVSLLQYFYRLVH
ncbi:hypothetical protein [Saccharolobus islandicus]|uniref:Uncharacterized protein n=1 Tax=Saccharolobus islandicus (strain HVE10/4) TaxID=930943 RepID=F0NPM9_SACI0|nr:hypothetical protein [Sulfolobus islandicus]ADX82786.1 hypothetical protein SiH_1438 [Sulfolobus islandicus HVE10/4]